jgi:hypothetical protein
MLEVRCDGVDSLSHLESLARVWRGEITRSGDVALNILVA